MSAQIVNAVSAIDYGQVAERAASILNQGGVVVFPTETVYGVGARADLPEAVGRLRRMKTRTDGKPFTVHIPRRESAWDYVNPLSGPGRRFVEKGWPGPLTLLFRVGDPRSAPVLAGRNGQLAAELYSEGQVGLRCPDHALASRLLGQAEGPVVAASANRAGEAPPLTAEQAATALASEVDLVIDAGRAQFARASTIVRVDGRRYEIVREGVYDERTVRRLACMNLLFVCSGNTCRSPMAAGICEKMLAEQLGCGVGDLPAHDVLVRSAGAFAMSGARATAEAVDAMRERGIDVTHHTSSALTHELINQADRIFAMTRSHVEAIAGMAPMSADKIVLLGGDSEIEDPLGKSPEEYEACARQIERALAIRLKEVEP